MTTIAEIEAKIACKIPGLLRELGVLQPGYRCEVCLRRKTRKMRRDADFERKGSCPG